MHSGGNEMVDTCTDVRASDAGQPRIDRCGIGVGVLLSEARRWSASQPWASAVWVTGLAVAFERHGIRTAGMRKQ